MAKSKKKIVAGLDLSLTHSGVVIFEGETVVFHKVIVSKPLGDRPIDELYRIQQIVTKIETIIHEFNPEFVCIENLAFMARNTTALVQLSALNFFVRAVLKDSDIPFCLVAPTSVKKFITGKGNADKNLIMMEVYKQFGFSSYDDNEADAAALGVIALAMVDKPFNKLSIPQLETVKLLAKQF